MEESALKSTAPRTPSSAPRPPPNPFPPWHPPHSPDLPAPRRPRMARLTSRGALCCPLPARGFPNTEDMATLRRGTRVLGPKAPSSVPARRGPRGRLAGSLGTRRSAPSKSAPRPRAPRGLGSRSSARGGGRRGRWSPAGGAAPSSAKLLVRAAGAPRGAHSPRRRRGGGFAIAGAPHHAWPPGPGAAATVRSAPAPGREGQGPERARPWVGRYRGSLFPAYSEPPLSLSFQQESPSHPLFYPASPASSSGKSAGFNSTPCPFSRSQPAQPWHTTSRAAFCCPCGDSQASPQHPGRTQAPGRGRMRPPY